MSSDAGAEVDAKGQSALHRAALSGEMEEVDRIVASGADIDPADKEGFTPLHVASEAGHLHVVDRLAEAKADLEAKGGAYRHTPLHLAAMEGHPATVDRLVAAGAAVDAKDHSGLTPLHLAAWHGHPATVDRLVAAGAAVNAKDHSGWKPLHLAAWHGHPAAVDRLVAAGAAVDAKSNGGQTPLHLAAECGHPEVAQRLLDAGADLKAQDGRGKTPWQCAKESLKEILRRANPAYIDQEEGWSALHTAAFDNDVEEVERQLVEGANIEDADKAGHTPLHLAARAGHFHVVDRLTGAKAHLEAKGGEYSRTPLHLAAEKDHCEVVDRLLAAKAAVEAQDKYRHTPLHFAAEMGHTATVDRLVAAGAAVDAKDNGGWTPLHHAARSGHSEVAQRLVDAGADVDARDVDGLTPWEVAKRYGQARRMAPVLRPVQVGLLSGRTVRCDPEPSRTVRDLCEEAQSKLGTGIKQLVTSSGTVLKEQLSLQEAGIDYTSFVTAIAPVTDGEEVSASQSAPQETDKDDEYKEVEFAVGITMVATTAVWRQYEPKVDVLQVESSLPDTMVPMAPVLKLTPEGVTFPAPIILRIPTCTGANKVFRSKDDGAWEEIREVKFAEDSCEVQLSHFCQVAITGDARPLKALGFIKATSSSSTVKLALLHVGCNRCNDELAWYLQDAQLLQGYQQCSEIEVIGQNDAVILSHSGTCLQELQLRSRSLPAISSEFARQSDAAFQVDINDGQRDFKVTYTAPPAPTNAGGYAASQSTASGSASAQVASSSNPSPQSIQQHVMLSGRFNRDDIKDYMRIVRRRLEELQVTTFMVEAGGGGEFGSLTLMGLGRAKAMVAFCTEEYGALTGVGYETFRELEFAHQQNLPLIPVRNHRVYPPQPSDSEMGRYQNRFILKPTLVYIADEEMQKPREVADQIAQALTTMGLHTPPGAPRAPRAPGAPARKAPPALPPAVSQAAPPAVPLVPHRPPGAPTRPSGRRPRPPVQPSLESMD